MTPRSHEPGPWLHLVGEGESSAPWTDDEWAPNPAAGDDLRILRERIRQGEDDLRRAVAEYRATTRDGRSAGDLPAG